MIKSILISLSLLVFTQFAFGQDRSVSDIMNKIEEVVELVESENQEVVRMEADLISSEKTTYRTLSTGWTYGLFAIGSSRVKDLDIEVFKKSGSSWVSIAMDNESTSAALVTVTPSETAEYKIVVKVLKFNGTHTVGHYGLVIYHE